MSVVDYPSHSTQYLVSASALSYIAIDYILARCVSNTQSRTLIMRSGWHALFTACFSQWRKPLLSLTQLPRQWACILHDRAGTGSRVTGHRVNNFNRVGSGLGSKIFFMSRPVIVDPVICRTKKLIPAHSSYFYAQNTWPYYVGAVWACACIPVGQASVSTDVASRCCCLQTIPPPPRTWWGTIFKSLTRTFTTAVAAIWDTKLEL